MDGWPEQLAAEDREVKQDTVNKVDNEARSTILTVVRTTANGRFWLFVNDSVRPEVVTMRRCRGLVQGRGTPEGHYTVRRRSLRWF